MVRKMLLGSVLSMLFCITILSEKEQRTFSKRLNETLRINAIINWLDSTKESMKNKNDNAIKLLPSITRVKGKSLYVCGAPGCDFCFASRKNSIMHVVKCHFLNETTIKERFEQYPKNDEALKLAFVKDIGNSSGARALKSMSSEYIDTMGDQAVIDLLNDEK